VPRLRSCSSWPTSPPYSGAGGSGDRARAFEHLDGSYGYDAEKYADLFQLEDQVDRGDSYTVFVPPDALPAVESIKPCRQ